MRPPEVPSGRPAPRAAGPGTTAAQARAGFAGTPALGRSYLHLSGGAFASKLLGALREMLLARFFGTGAVADAYRSGLTLTLSPAHFVTGQIVETCFVPLYARYRESDRVRAWALFQGLLLGSIVAGLAVGAVLWVFSGPLVGLLLPGFGPERREMTAAMLRILALGMPAYLYSALLSALGTAQEDFIIPSLRPGLQNLGMLVLIPVGALSGHPVWIAWGFTVTYLALAVWGTLLLIARNHFPRAFVFSPALFAPLGAALWRLLRPLLPVAVLIQANLILERSLASLVGPGTVAALDYARFVTDSTNALLILPLGLISLARFSGLDERAARDEAGGIFALILLAFAPLSAFLLVNGRALLALLFLRGAYDVRSLDGSARALAGLSAGLWAFSACQVLRRVLNARLCNGRVLAAEGLGVALNAGFNLLLYRRLGILALGLGPSVGALGSLILYGRGLALGAEAKARLRLLAWTLPPYAAAAFALSRAARGLPGLGLQSLFAALYWGYWIGVRGRRIRGAQ